MLVALALVRPRWTRGLERGLGRLLGAPARAGRWALALAAVTFAAQALSAVIAGIPEPRIHDEQSMLLQADTFLHGRLANETPPHWQHFQTFHVLIRPTYASKYPPAQGAVLALGMLLGHPLIGVWLAGAAFVAAAAWALQAWLPPPWARLGALLLATNVVVGTLWSLGYRGAFVPAAAGALLFGAAERLRGRPRAWLGVGVGAALAVLALSRPYEGLVAALAALLPLLGLAVRDPSWRRNALRRAAPAALACVACGLGWLAYYNFRVTGHPLRFPFLAYDVGHARVPLYLWQELREPPPTDPHIEAFYSVFEAEEWERQHTVAGWLAAAWRKTYSSLLLYLRRPFLLALVALPVVLRSPRPALKRATWALAALLASQLPLLPGQPHYVSPGAVLFALLAVECWRRLRAGLSARTGRASRLRAVAAVLPLAALLDMAVRVGALSHPIEEWPNHQRAVRERLLSLPGPDLVIVGYDPRATEHIELVFNDADPASTPVLWARSRSLAEDCALVRAMPHRRAWSLQVVEELSPPRLTPFSTAACAGAGAADAATAPRPPRTAPAAPPPATAR